MFSNSNLLLSVVTVEKEISIFTSVLRLLVLMKQDVVSYKRLKKLLSLILVLTVITSPK